MSRTLEQLLCQPLCTVSKHYPAVSDFLAANGLDLSDFSFEDLVRSLSDEWFAGAGTTPDVLLEDGAAFFAGLLGAESIRQIESLEVLSGFDKAGCPEACSLMLKPGDVTCIVGPTGSGKSRLLADIEWLACGDTPTRRTVKLNGSMPDDSFRSSHSGRLVAQITQNMNFVLDMNVSDFLLMHARSRYLENAEDVVSEVIDIANDLSGESFRADTPVTFLSGGQSRALMIADVACIGRAPVVLIDEIENAGTDKRRALELLIQRDKIVLMATHDPLLILQADRRVVIRNGGMSAILATNDHERQLLRQLEEMDSSIQQARSFFRSGKSLTGVESLGNLSDNRE